MYETTDDFASMGPDLCAAAVVGGGCLAKNHALDEAIGLTILSSCTIRELKLLTFLFVSVPALCMQQTIRSDLLSEFVFIISPPRTWFKEKEFQRKCCSEAIKLGRADFLQAMYR